MLVSAAGLGESEAAARLAAEGPNELPRAERRDFLRILVSVVLQPMFGLLLGAGTIYLLLGDLAEALLLLAFASVSVTIATVQESRSERVLEALRNLTSPRALVLRGGERKRIAGREVVRGDTVILVEGDRVPADGVLLAAEDLQIDESLLTGEAVAVRKIASGAPDTPPRPGGDDLPFVFSGTLVVRGHGTTEVTATGARSAIGKIGLGLRSIATEPTRLSLQTARLVRDLAIAGIGVSLVAVLLYGLLRGSWLDGLLGGIALSMSMLPEEFPLVLTVFMVMGAWRISRTRVLTRRAATIETLGAATVLCTDKTGTLTQNRMSLVALRRGAEISGAGASEFSADDLLRIGILACAEQPFDPMERAFHALGAERGFGVSGRRLLRNYGLRPELLAVSNVWSGAASEGLLVAAKGAPEAILRLCRIGGARRAAIAAAVDAMAGDGLRVLGVATASPAGTALPDSQVGLDFTFVGLAGLADPLRTGVPEAVRECRSAGIRVVMITGDYPATAAAIARQAGIASDAVLSGAEIGALSDDELARRLKTVSIFARIMPEQKLRIVEALKAAGEIVAMTGDGVNDAPSLKAAHIGIAMGGRGTDVAREAASLVLLDDDFGSIVRTVRLGRRIYDNLRKAMGYILAVHVPIAGLALLPLSLGLPIIFAPVHIAFLEMVIDPVCSIVFEAEAEEEDVMRRPPRHPQSALFSTPLLLWGLLQSALVLIAVAGIFVVALRRGEPASDARALAFVALIVGNLALVLANRSFGSSLILAFRRPNPVLWWVFALAALLLALAVTWPPAQALFRFGPLHPDDVVLCVLAGLAVLAALELLKPIWRVSLRV